MQAMEMLEKIRREISILDCLDHPHITRLYELIDTPTDIFVVMEYVAGKAFELKRCSLTFGSARLRTILVRPVAA